jgi:hypothetical protein
MAPCCFGLRWPALRAGESLARFAGWPPLECPLWKGAWVGRRPASGCVHLLEMGPASGLGARPTAPTLWLPDSRCRRRPAPSSTGRCSKWAGTSEFASGGPGPRGKYEAHFRGLGEARLGGDRCAASRCRRCLCNGRRRNGLGYRESPARASTDLHLARCAQVAILDRDHPLPVRDRRVAFWERPTPALADRRFLG